MYIVEIRKIIMSFQNCNHKVERKTWNALGALVFVCFVQLLHGCEQLQAQFEFVSEIGDCQYYFSCTINIPEAHPGLSECCQ
jgi:hypothetical protein